jgi:hypothetical protein
MRRHVFAVGLMALTALFAGACGKGKTPGTSGAPEGGAPPAAESGIPWSQDTVWAASQPPAAGTAARIVTLEFAPDGNARMTTEHAGRGTGIDVGWWSVRNDTLALQLATLDGKASGTTSTWKIAGPDLVPLVYNPQEWGAAGVPLRVRPRTAP